MPWNNVADSYQIRDDILLTKGRHQLKMVAAGCSTRRPGLVSNTQGDCAFNGSFTGNNFADYLLGYAQNYTENALKERRPMERRFWGLYLQDNWRVNDRLTLNLGLRWDTIPTRTKASNQIANFYPTSITPATRRLYSQATPSTPLSPASAPA